MSLHFFCDAVIWNRKVKLAMQFLYFVINERGRRPFSLVEYFHVIGVSNLNILQIGKS